MGQGCHNMNSCNSLNTSSKVTGLPASLVKISCSKCSYFLLCQNMKMMVLHLLSAHKVEQASLLRYSCRVCDGQFSTIEKVIKHSNDHKIERRKRSFRRSRSKSSTECIEGKKISNQ